MEALFCLSPHGYYTLASTGGNTDIGFRLSVGFGDVRRVTTTASRFNSHLASDSNELMASLIAGLAGGVVATIVMTAVMMVMGDGGPPPTARLVSKFAGGDPEDYAMPGMILHLLYGIVAGAVFAVGVPLLGLALGSVIVAAALGLVYGLVLMVVGMVFWMRMIIGIEAERDMMMMFGTVHAVYGIVLGVFLGTGILA